MAAIIRHRHPGNCPCVDKRGAHAVIPPAAHVQLARHSPRSTSHASSPRVTLSCRAQSPGVLAARQQSRTSKLIIVYQLLLLIVDCSVRHCRANRHCLVQQGFHAFIKETHKMSFAVFTCTKDGTI